MKTLKLKSSETAKEPQVRIKWAQGLTMTKNYNGMRFDCGIELLCTADEIDKTFEKAKKCVEAQLESALDDNKTVLGDLSLATK